jgi:hypothetical protein
MSENQIFLFVCRWRKRVKGIRLQHMGPDVALRQGPERTVPGPPRGHPVQRLRYCRFTGWLQISEYSDCQSTFKLSYNEHTVITSEPR